MKGELNTKNEGSDFGGVYRSLHEFGSYEWVRPCFAALLTWTGYNWGDERTGHIPI
jgi:hypothetical protein